LFGARNEVLAFQVIVESDARGIQALSASLPELRQRGGTARIVYTPPAADPSQSAGRPIEVFAVHYMNVTQESHAVWVWVPGSPPPRRAPGWAGRGARSAPRARARAGGGRPWAGPPRATGRSGGGCAPRPPSPPLSTTAR